MAESLAIAYLQGGPLAPEIKGTVTFRDVQGGTKVTVEIWGLPRYQPAGDGKQAVGPHAFQLHENGNCRVGDPGNPFMAAGGQWNPGDQPQGNRAGDFPVLFSNRGFAFMSFFTDKLSVADVIGKAVVIHEGPDDYRMQTTGNSGRRLACGMVRRSRDY